MRQGARSAVVTADAAGAALLAAGGRHWLPAPRVAEVRNPIGAGDVLAAGLAAALERGEPLAAAARARRRRGRRPASSTRPAGELDPARAQELADGMPKLGADGEAPRDRLPRQLGVAGRWK